MTRGSASVLAAIRKSALLLLVIALALIGAGCTLLAKVPKGYEPREGDVVFQSLPRLDLVVMIEGATHSPYSHCGVVAREDGRWVVIEAMDPVTTTPLGMFAARGREGMFDVYRPQARYDARMTAFVDAAKTFVGRPYDFRFRMDDEKIYCSELVYKAFQTATGEPLGKLVKVSDLDWKPHEKTIRKYEGGPAPLDREMITPRDLAKAEQLELVFRDGKPVTAAPGVKQN